MEFFKLLCTFFLKNNLMNLHWKRLKMTLLGCGSDWTLGYSKIWGQLMSECLFKRQDLNLSLELRLWCTKWSWYSLCSLFRWLLKFNKFHFLQTFQIIRQDWLFWWTSQLQVFTSRILSSSKVCEEIMDVFMDLQVHSQKKILLGFDSRDLPVWEVCSSYFWQNKHTFYLALLSILLRFKILWFLA